jgi:hypothetical protein
MRSVLVLVAIVALFVTGCGESRYTTASGEVTPEWVQNPKCDGKFGAIGESTKMASGRERKRAIHRGRVALAEDLNSKIQAAIKDHTSDAGISGDDSFTQSWSEVSRNVVNLHIKGSHEDKLWRDSQGTVFARVVLAPEAIEEIAKHMEKVSNGKLSRSYMAAKILHEEADADLDRLVGEADARTDATAAN